MKNLNVGGILNHCNTVAKMVAEEQAKDKKHAENTRCKSGNYSGVAAYIEYAFGVPCTAEEIKENLK